MTNLILASQSPRRKSLLTQLGYEFSCMPANIDETTKVDEQPSDYVARLAYEKAANIANSIIADSTEDKTPFAVLGSDTSVVIDGRILGKPEDFNDFASMMNLLSGNCHQVMTAISVVTRQTSETQVIVADVYFASLTEQDIKAYWETGEPQDKAGGYGIQGIAGKFVTKINGSYSAIVGLPLYETDQLLNQMLTAN